MSVLRRDAARAQREFEKRTAGGPIRVRRDSPQARRATREPTLILVSRPDYPSERGHRETRAAGAFFRPSGRGAAAPACLWRVHALTEYVGRLEF